MNPVLRSRPVIARSGRHIIDFGLQQREPSGSVSPATWGVFHVSVLLEVGPPSAPWEELALLGSERRLVHRERLVHQGGPVESVDLVLGGTGKAVVDLDSGRELTLAVLGAGDLVGGAEMLAAAAAHPATVIALGELVVRRIPEQEFVGFLEGHPGAATAMARFLAGRLAASDRRRVAAASLSVPRRLAAHLVELADPADDDAGAGVVELSQSELASLMATSRDTTIRALRHLRTLGLVGTQRRMVRVHSLERLRRYASHGAR